jgi:hypothetical protein
VAEKTVAAYVNALPAKQRAAANAVRTLVKAAAPDAVESIKWGQPVFTDHGPFAYLKKASAHVTFGFWRGTELDGGRGILEGSGTRMAHVKIADVSEIDDKQLTGLIRSAVKLNREKGDPTKR